MRDHAEPFDRILTSLHEVALDYPRWSVASALIDEALGTHGSSMLFADGDSEQDIRVYFAWTLYRGEPDPEAERYYYEHCYATDERAPGSARPPTVSSCT